MLFLTFVYIFSLLYELMFTYKSVIAHFRIFNEYLERKYIFYIIASHFKMVSWLSETLTNVCKLLQLQISSSYSFFSGTNIVASVRNIKKIIICIWFFSKKISNHKTMLITILTHALLLLLAGITLAYLWAVRRNGYWARNRVAHIRGVPFLGSLTNLVLARQSTADLFRQIYENPLFATEPVVGIEYFHQPALMVRDPQLVKQLLIKDFDAFSERYSI